MLPRQGNLGGMDGGGKKKIRAKNNRTGEWGGRKKKTVLVNSVEEEYGQRAAKMTNVKVMVGKRDGIKERWQRRGGGAVGGDVQ